MNQQQLILGLDLSAPPQLVDRGKKLARITFTGSPELHQFIRQFASLQRTSVSELMQRYVIVGLQSDLGTMLLNQANQNKTLGELLKRRV